jgi:hypothetical protein
MSGTKRWGVCLALASAVAVAAPPATATQMVLQSLEQMTYRADAVVRAVPTGERPVSRWTNPDGTGLIVTTTTLRVIESYSGSVRAGQTLTVEHLGGIVGDTYLMVPGMVQFRPDEEVVLFAQRSPAGTFHVLDLSMGKFEVGRDADGSRLLGRRDLQNVEMVGDTPESPRLLSTLRDRVGRAAVRKAQLLRQGRALPEPSGARDDEEVR